MCFIQGVLGGNGNIYRKTVLAGIIVQAKNLIFIWINCFVLDVLNLSCLEYLQKQRILKVHIMAFCNNLHVLKEFYLWFKICFNVIFFKELLLFWAVLVLYRFECLYQIEKVVQKLFWIVKKQLLENIWNQLK